MNKVIVIIFISIFIIFVAIVFISMLMSTILTGDSSTKKISDNLAALEDMELSGDMSYDSLGSLSAKYESNGNPATIANNPGDIGGKSYGAYQFAVNVGGMTNFLIFLKNYDKTLYNRLMAARNKDGGYGSNFDNEWRAIAAEDAEYFFKVQHECIKQNYYFVVIEDFKNVGFDWTKRSLSVQNVIWSIAVQHGTGGAFTLISTQDYKQLENQPKSVDAIFINGVYAERRKVEKYFSGSGQSIKDSVYNRFIQEEKDALVMLSQEIKEIGG